MKVLILKRLNFFANALYCLIAFSSVFMLCDGIKNIIPNEYLISYQDGMIRRGLIGNILFLICENFNISAKILIPFFIYFLVLLNALIIIYIFIKRKIDPFILFTSSFLLNIWGYHIVFRLDLILIPLILLQLTILKSKTIPINYKFVIVFFLSILGILVHEVYFLITTFTLLFIFWNNFKLKKNTFLFIFTCLLALIFFLIIKHFEGNSSQIDIILSSWKKYGILPKNHQYLYWLFSLNSPIFIWDTEPFVSNKIYTLGFLINFGCILSILTFYLNHFYNIKNLKFQFFILINFLIILFLCFIATDFIRWYYLISIIIIYYFSFFGERKKDYLNTKYILFKLGCIFVGLPMYGWTPTHYFWTSPLKYLINLSDYF